jgi:pimeloyl-ACP methyl ester carboxylesterase
MNVALSLLLFLAAANPLETQFAQVGPVPADGKTFTRTAGQKRAVVLIHGFKPHPFSNGNAQKADWHSWQKADSGMVKSLAKDSDVYAFAYSQNDAVEKIAALPDLKENIDRLKQLGYEQVVLVGHSAGGVVARLFVEDHPDAPVTKVVQVCAPNAGTRWGKGSFGVGKSQEPFVESLTHESRQRALKERADKTIPQRVEFVCVVCQLQSDSDESKDSAGDGVVSCASQWSEDLQRQNIPAVCLPCWHLSVMRCRPGEEKIAELVREKQPRWTPDKVAAEKVTILGLKTK